MNERRNEIRRENRKAIKKFIAVLIISGLVGALLGGVGTAYAGKIQAIGADHGRMIGEILFYAFPILFAGIHIWSAAIYHKYRKVKDLWDGEDEIIADRIDNRISYVIWAECIATALGFLYFALLMGADHFSTISVGKKIAVVIIFVMHFVFITLIEQRCIDLTKEMNPEKQGSVYDMHFNKKWMASCDEAEKMQMYQCAWVSYRVTNLAFIFTWALTFLMNEFFNTGLFACGVVILLWIIQNSAYCYQSIHGKK